MAELNGAFVLQCRSLLQVVAITADHRLTASSPFNSPIKRSLLPKSPGAILSRLVASQYLAVWVAPLAFLHLRLIFAPTLNRTVVDRVHLIYFLGEYSDSPVTYSAFYPASTVFLT